jgi:hypothetical protein
MLRLKLLDVEKNWGKLLGLVWEAGNRQKLDE